MQKAFIPLSTVSSGHTCVCPIKWREAMALSCFREKTAAWEIRLLKEAGHERVASRLGV